MKGIKISALVLIILLSVAGYVLTKDEASSPHAQNQCPVSGRKVKNDVFTDHEGNRVYFCCPGCIPAFKKAPEKFMKKMNAEGVVLAKAASEGSCCAKTEKKSCSKGCSCDAKMSAGKSNQKKCPVMGGTIKKEVFADYEGKRVYFCCPGCIPAFKKAPEKFMKKMNAEGVVLAKAASAGSCCTMGDKKSCSKGCSCDAKTCANKCNQKKCPVMGGTIKKEVFADYEGKRVYFCCPGCIPAFKKNPEKIVKKMEVNGIILAKTPGSVKSCSGGTCSSQTKLWESKNSKSGACCSTAKSCSQKTCPMSGMKVNKEIFADYKGERVYFCGSGCREVFKKDPAKFVKKMKVQGIDFEKLENKAKDQDSKKNPKENRESS